MSNQSAAPSINCLECASKKSSKKQNVKKISKKTFGEFKHFGGSDVSMFWKFEGRKDFYFFLKIINRYTRLLET